MGELGSLLTRAREARGLTLEDAERDTRISRRYLQALETEQFELIPAPVYARGFLRSYSQYLGLDPQEALSMFPREEDPEYQRAADARTPAQRASRETPVSPVSASRPTWRGPSREQIGGDSGPEERIRAVPPRRATQEPAPPPPGRRATRPQPAAAAPEDGSWEPMIGVDIGVPNPANRIKTDPAAQTRSMVIAIVAIAAVLAVVLMAFLISNLGGEEETPGLDADATSTTADGSTTTTAGTTPNGSLGEPIEGVVRGIVPDLDGLDEETARRAIAQAGYKASERRIKDSTAAKGTIINQAPAPGIELAEGLTVNIVISEGP